MQSSMAVIDIPEIDIRSDMGITIAALEERVNNHIKFFWVVVAFGFAWLGAITVLLIQTKGTVSRVEQAQANAPAQIVASLLNKPATSKSELADNLDAISTILRASKVGLKKPDSSALKSVSTKLSEVQQQYPDLPQVWQATGAFISYKSAAGKIPPVTNQCNEALLNDGWMFSNCDVSLENLAERIRDVTINGIPAPFTFLNSVVHYKGGSIPASRLTFINCVFRFEVPISPTPEGMLTMRKLTTADTDQVVAISLS